ncbi:trans-2,3-dihydro-3-hydroxyanthranilate isomerase [Bacillus mesophilus]|uniref:PhzF family phenazine biosynthesis protein n=1 Tax=Bacillus mesophilus TaxID=1808955 RepID=A0A6M0Q299_9BACI|nr:PhzF family phenazine biosynthesis protein [Bacillus mesophilus]MBM7659643.1 trans-2,3-dihydro-3-hydroxyanthranilate isomerase [Bacillus mesophilus]NEY70511.1 PhzF family phenazine biosynthesis protein [Bacillus mesophilus]
MRMLNYNLLDVFTTTLFGGNQLAVFSNGEGLTSEQMQMIAKELNLSETVFLFPPTTERRHFKLKIFTPAMELPFAGHPTIGTAFLLGEKKMTPYSHDGLTALTVEENIGLVPLHLYAENGEITKAEMIQPIPEVTDQMLDYKACATLLSLDEQDLDTELPIQTISAGIPFLFIPIKSLEAMKKIQFRMDVWQKLFSNDENKRHIFAFSVETEQEDAHVHSRMFAPAMGISEDPATGSASGPLGFYLVENKLIEHHDGLITIISEQGIEMGRPSRIEITLERIEGKISKVLVGGSAVIIGEGSLRLP